MKVYEINNGLILRMAMLMTHYRHPFNYSDERMSEARKILEKFYMAAVPTLRLCPTEIVESFGQDLNTPQAITIMHKLCKTDKEGLFAALKFIGLLDGVCQPDELKTLPKEDNSDVCETV